MPNSTSRTKVPTIYLSTSRNRLWTTRLSVRLILAVDRQFIVDNIKGRPGPAGAFVPIGLSDADPTKEFREVGGDYYDPTGAGYEANSRRRRSCRSRVS